MHAELTKVNKPARGERPLHDLCSNRLQLVRQRTQNILSIQTLIVRNTAIRLSKEESIASAQMLVRYRDAWDNAADRTPHGSPIELKREDFPESVNIARWSRGHPPTFHHVSALTT